MHLLDLFFPRRCVNCGKLGRYFCKNCLNKIQVFEKSICPICAKPAIDGATHPRCKTKYGIDGIFILSHYTGPLRQAIHLLKYKFVFDLSEELIDLLVKYYPSIYSKYDLLIPVPLHPKREKERGFNQAEKLANILAKRWQVKLDSKILQRTKYTTPQVKLKGRQREGNVKGIFSCIDKNGVMNKKIALVDDVSTTRATLIECAKILKRAGAKSVWGIVLAHG